MGALGIVGHEPTTDPGRPVRIRACRKGGLEELLYHSAVEALNEAVGLRMAHFGVLVGNVAEQQIQLVGMLIGSVELEPSVGEDLVDREVAVPIEGEHIVMQYGDGSEGGGTVRNDSDWAHIPINLLNL